MNKMTRSSPPYLKEVQIVDRGIAPEERSILATVPSHTLVDQDGSHEPSPELYRQSLKAILGTPEIESRLNYVTATMIVSIFGGWLATKAIKSSTMKAVANLALLFLVTGMIGLLIGILIGQEVLPLTTLSVLLIATLCAMLFLLGILVRDMSRRTTGDFHQVSHTSIVRQMARRVAVPVRTRSISRRTRIN